jgi:hypothetical protein
MTTLFTRTLMKGIADGLSDGGAMPPFANDDFATGIFDKIATDLGLPDILSEHLPNEAYVKIGQLLLGSAKVAEANGLTASATTQAMAKQASSMDLSDRALGVAAFYMDKAAEEASLNGTGTNTPESAAATNSIARLDQTNRSSLQYLVGMGNTDMPEGGVIGRQMMHPMAPRGPSINNSLSRLDKMASSEDLSAEDAELSPEEMAQLHAMQQAHEAAGEKVGRALTFMDGLANRGAGINAKTVLASAILADSGTTGLEVMANIVGNTKTAEELDGHLDHVLAAGEEHGAGADPHLVHAIEEALAAHGDHEEGEDEGDEDEEEAMKAAGLMDDVKDVGKDIYRKGKGLGKDYVKAQGKKVKNYAGKAVEEVRRRTGTETTGMKARDAYGKAKDKVEELGNMTGKQLVEKAKDKGTTPAAALVAGSLGVGAGVMAARRKKDDESEKDAALLSFLKAAADGSLNEVEENTPEDAAHHNANAELDMQNRTPHEYLEGAGKSNMPNVGHRGASMAAPKGPAKVNPDNTATRETKSASFDYKVKAAAEFWGPKLPATMAQSEKRAHVIALAGMPEDLQSGYVGSLYSR